MTMRGHFAQVGAPGKDLGGTVIKRFVSTNSNHVLLVTPISGENAHAISFLEIIRSSGPVVLDDFVIDATSDPYAYHASDPSRYVLRDVNAGGDSEHMVVVEETPTDLHFVLWSNSIYGEDGAYTTGGNRRFVDGWLYPSYALIPFRYDKTTGQLTATDGTGRFAKWDDYTFVPEAGGANIVGNRPWINSTTSRTASDVFSVETRILDLGGGQYGLIWRSAGTYDPASTTIFSQDINATMLTRWHWDSATKAVVIEDEQVVHFPVGNDSIITDCDSLVAPDGDIVVVKFDTLVNDVARLGRFDPNDPPGTLVVSDLTEFGEPDNGWGINGRRAAARWDGDVLVVAMISDYTLSDEAFVQRLPFNGRSVGQVTQVNLDKSPWHDFEAANRNDDFSFFYDICGVGFDSDGSVRHWRYFGHFTDNTYIDGQSFAFSMKLDPSTGEVIESEGKEITTELPSGKTSASYSFGAPPDVRPYSDYSVGWSYSRGGMVRSDSGELDAVLWDAMEDWQTSYPPADTDQEQHVWMFSMGGLLPPVIGPGERRSRFVFS